MELAASIVTGALFIAVLTVALTAFVIYVFTK